MENIHQILEYIENNNIWDILRKGTGDIDIFVKNKKELDIFLSSQWATKFYEDNYKIRYYLFLNWGRISLDGEKKFWYISERFFHKFWINRKLDLADYTTNKIIFDSLRYLFLFRKNKFLYFKENFEYLKNNNFFQDTLNEKILRWNFSSMDELKMFLYENPIILFKKLRFKYFLLYVLYKMYFPVKIILYRLFYDNTFAILWYDGSGKTTIVEILSREFWVPYFYMGFKRYSQRWYYKILGVNNFTKIIRLLFIYFDFLFLYIQIFYFKIRYEFVFFDRYPKNEIYPHSKYAEIFINIIFFFYPSPKKYFVLYNSPAVIRKRKNERTEDEIIKLNKYIKNTLLKNKKVIAIKNDDIDSTLNKILSEIY